MFGYNSRLGSFLFKLLARSITWTSSASPTSSASSSQSWFKHVQTQNWLKHVETCWNHLPVTARLILVDSTVERHALTSLALSSLGTTGSKNQLKTTRPFPMHHRLFATGGVEVIWFYPNKPKSRNTGDFPVVIQVSETSWLCLRPIFRLHSIVLQKPPRCRRWKQNFRQWIAGSSWSRRNRPLSRNQLLSGWYPFSTRSRIPFRIREHEIAFRYPPVWYIEDIENFGPQRSNGCCCLLIRTWI